MANDLSNLTAKSADMTLSSPDLARLRRISLGTIQWPGEGARKYLSEGSTLTERDRADAETLGRELDVLLLGETGSNAQGRIVLLTKLLMAYPAVGVTAAGAEARAEAYLTALDDIPAWAIAEAIRKWHRGEFGMQYDYTWAPAPAILRRVAEKALAPVKEALQRITDVLKAKPLAEMMQEHGTAAVAALKAAE
jgi:hypothetical protein